MRKRIYLAVMISLFLVFGSPIWEVGFNKTSQAAAAEPIVWKLQDTYEAVGLTAKHLTRRFIEVVESVSQGQIKITRYEPGAFCGPIEALDALSKGMFDAAALYPGYYVGTIPVCFVEQGLPFGWTNQEAAWYSYRKLEFEKLLRQEYAKKNIFWLSGGTINDLYNIGTSKPIHKLADAKGMKIRALGVYGDYVKLLGATPTVVPQGEMYMALKLRTIDGILGAAWYYETLKLGEVLKYYLLPNTNVIGFNFSVNMNSWNKVPEALKAPLIEALASAFWESAVSYGAERMYIDDKLIIEKYGIKYTTLPKSEEEWLIKECQSKIWPKIAEKDAACAKGVEIVRKSRDYLGLVTAK